MKLTHVILLAVALIAVGCQSAEVTPAIPPSKAQVLLDAQLQSIETIKTSMESLRAAQPSNVSEWSTQAVQMYGRYQEQLQNLTKQRQDMIDKMSRSGTDADFAPGSSRPQQPDPNQNNAQPQNQPDPNQNNAQPQPNASAPAPSKSSILPGDKPKGNSGDN